MGTNSCQSPVQPRRSRVGQSVGMSQALPRKLHTAASCRRFEPLVAAREPAAPLEVGVHDDAGDVVGGERARVALDAHVAEAVRGEPRLEDVALDAGGDHPVDLPAVSGSGRNGRSGARWSVVTSPSGPSASAWVSTSSVPAGPRSVSRTRPLMFWPRSTTWTPGRSSVTETGRISSTARTGGAGEVTSASNPRSTTWDRRPLPGRAAAGPRAGPRSGRRA